MNARYALFVLSLLALMFIIVPKFSTQAQTPGAMPAPTAAPVKAKIHIADPEQPPPTDKVYEVTPDERPGYLWVEGFWDWNGKKHVWRAGHWVKERPGYVWVADTWAQRGAKWHLYPGHWEKEQTTADGMESDTDADADADNDVNPQPAANAPKKRKRVNYSDKKHWPRYVRR